MSSVKTKLSLYVTDVFLSYSSWLSSLQYFMSMDEESFWSVIDRCPECTSYPLFDAYYRRLHRRDSQLLNMLNQENYLDIDLLFKPSLELQPRISGKRRLLRGRCIEGCPSETRTSFKRTKSSVWKIKFVLRFMHLIIKYITIEKHLFYFLTTIFELPSMINLIILMRYDVAFEYHKRA